MALTKKYNMWNVNFICIFIINFIICFVFYMSTSSSGEYATRVLNASDGMAGLATGIFVIGALFARLYFGSIIDNINVKKTIIISLIFYLIGNLIYFFINSIGGLIIARAFSGIFYGICSCGAGAAIARIIPSNKKGIGIGYYAISVILSSAFGPAIAINLASKDRFTLCFAISVVSIIVALISGFILKVRRFKKHHHTNTAKRFSVWNYYEKSTLNIGIISFLLGFAYSAFLVYMGSFANHLTLVDTNNYIISYTMAGSLFFVVYASISVFSRPIAGKLFDKKGPHFIIIPSIIFLIISFLVLSNTIHPLMIFLAAFFCALGYGSASSSAQSLALRVCPPHKAGLANSSYFIALDLGVGVGPYALGILKPFIGVVAIFYTCAVLIFLALILYYILIIKVQKVK